jgi:hypothetical protein
MSKNKKKGKNKKAKGGDHPPPRSISPVPVREVKFAVSEESSDEEKDDSQSESSTNSSGEDVEADETSVEAEEESSASGQLSSDSLLTIRYSLISWNLQTSSAPTHR